MSTSMPAPATQGTSRVAIVSRPDDASKATLAFIEQLGLQPVLVAEPTIEELDKLRGLDFAIVMLSAEDLGAGSRSTFLGIGFLLGVLPRGRLCCLLPEQAAPVPELGGMPRHTLDAGGFWRLLLAREMRQAGLDVDMNKAL